MNIKNILANSAKPALYEKGTAVMWTDEHISKQLLQVHLNTEIDLASRKQKTIQQTVEWILHKADKNTPLEILDLGCGPGLYAELFAEEGHRVTGVDFSKSSIEYAQKEAKSKKLDIKYVHANYLELEMKEQSFDLVILIFTDMGVLLPEEREKMIRFAHSVLKPGGTFIFDVLNDREIENKKSPKNWEVAKGGFWKPKPYLALSESFLYEQEKIILYQHVLVDENSKVDVYRFWTHFFSHSVLEKMLQKSGFEQFRFYENIIHGSGPWEGENITFVVAQKE